MISDKTKYLNQI